VEDDATQPTGGLRRDVDVVVPPRLAALAWTRWWRGPSVSDGPCGRGWWTIAQAALRAGPDGLVLDGPTGPVPVPPAGGRVDGLAAVLVPDGDGWSLVWDPASVVGAQRWAFTGDGALAAIGGAALGHTTVHRAQGRMVRLDHDGGRTLRLEWAERPGWGPRIVLVRLTDGRRVHYGHDDRGDLVAVRGAIARRYEVDDHGRLAGAWDADGVPVPPGPHRRPAPAVLAPEVVVPGGRAADVAPVKQVLDADGCLLSATDGRGAVTTFEPHPAGLPRTIRYADGAQVRIERDDAGRVLELVDTAGAVTRFERSPAGRVTAVVDALGHRTELGHGPHGLVERVTDPLGHVVRLRYDGAGHLCALVDAEGARWDVAGADAVVDVAPSPAGVDAGAVDAIAGTGDVGASDANDGPGRRWTFRHDGRGRVISAASPSGRSVRVERDVAGRVAAVEVGASRWTAERDRVGRIVGLTDPLGGRTAREHDAAGHLAAMTDPAGARTVVRRDGRGAIVAVTDPTGVTVTVRRDGRGLPVEMCEPGGARTRFWRDGSGRVVAMVAATGERFQYRRDHRGAVTVVLVDEVVHLVVERDGAGRPVVVAEPERGRVQRVAWTPAGRLASWSSGQDEVTWTYDAAGRVATRTGLGDHRRYERDADGRLVGLHSGRLGAVRLGRDADGRLTRLDAAGLRRWWRYDDRGWLVHYTEQVGSEVPRATRLVRDRAGRIVDVTGPEGDQALLGYDQAGRLADRVDPTGVVHYEHDAAGRLTAEGRPGSPGRRYRFDGARRLVSIDGEGGPLEVEHDAAGRRRVERGPAGGRRFRYGPTGHLAGITWFGDDGHAAAADIAIDIDIDGLGRLVGVGGQTLAWAPGGGGLHPDRIAGQHVDAVAGQLLALTAVDAADRSVRWMSTDWRGTVAGEPPGAPLFGEVPGGLGLGVGGAVTIDGLRWTGDRFHDDRTGHDLAPPAPVRLSLAPAHPAPPTAPPAGSAVARGMTTGHWDGAALVRDEVIAGVGDAARAALAGAYDLVGLPGARQPVDIGEVMARVRARPVVAADPPAGP
jgi:YD repeat-containing protein